MQQGPTETPTARRRRRARLAAVAPAVVALVAASCGGGGDGEPTEPTIAADAASIVDAAATAMGETTSVRFELRRSGAPVFIDPAEAVTLESATGEFTVPRSARAVLAVEVDGALDTELGAIAIDDEVWLSNPITGRFETLPAGYDLDPSLFFDPEDGWRPLLESLRDVELIGRVDLDGAARYRVDAIAPAAQIEAISAGLVRDQDVPIELWLQPVTGEVRRATFTAEAPAGQVTWQLDLDEYGAEFAIEPPEDVAG